MGPTSASRVVIATIQTATVSSKFCDSMINLVAADRGRTIAGRLAMLTGPLLSRGRNKLTADFLAQDEVDWLLWIDSDMVFSPDAVTRLLASADPVERPLVGGFYLIVWPNGEVLPTVFVRDRAGDLVNATSWPAQALMECEAVGAGFMLVHRRVLEAVRDRGFNTVYPWFQEGDGDGGEIGEDVTFCLRAGELGFPVHVNTGVSIGHHKTIVVDQAMLLRSAAGPVAP